jgi:hypothetical protein
MDKRSGTHTTLVQRLRRRQFQPSDGNAGAYLPLVAAWAPFFLFC